MTPIYSDLYKVWQARTDAPAVTARMTRKALSYLAGALGADDWTSLPAVPEQHALVLLDATLARTSLGSQSRSNYRNYLRRFYRALTEEGLDFSANGTDQLWAPAPNQGSVPRRAQIAYERFVKWAIGRGIWPRTVKPQDVLDWALHEKKTANQHWRKDYKRLQEAWICHAADGVLEDVAFPPLPAQLNGRYAISIDHWPAHLRTEWEDMSRNAAAPLRKGGMRPWRTITQSCYEKRLSLFLGWFVQEHHDRELAAETWATLLTAERCQEYLNWAVARTGKACLNPAHTGFLRFVRGLHRFLLGSSSDVIRTFTDLCKRCEVEERDKAVRMAPFPAVEAALRQLLDSVREAMSSKRSASGELKLARMQVDVIIWGLLTSRALRRKNVVELKIGTNLMRAGDGFELRFSPAEMKGHRKYETTVPAELASIIEDYLRRGYRALTGRAPADGDVLLVTKRGKPFTGGTFAACVERLSVKLAGKRLHPHLFRHIVATHAAQVWKMTPTELAAFLAHRSVMTVMKYYEVTNPARAAERFDQFRSQLPPQ